MSEHHPNHELKFVISNNRINTVIKWLDSYCIPDSKFPIGKISSIYYDTKNWSFLNEKINSDYLKRKIRIRWYYNINKDYYYESSFVEAKFKIGNQRKKVRRITALSGYELSKLKLNDPELLSIPQLIYKEGVVISENIYPAFQISYIRKRYIEPYTHSRICFDYNISTPRVNHLMIGSSNPFDLHTAVFEIKGKENALPFSLYPLIDMGFRKSAFSKYGECFRKIMESMC